MDALDEQLNIGLGKMEMNFATYSKLASLVAILSPSLAYNAGSIYGAANAVYNSLSS